MNSVSARKVWVFAARVVGEEDEEDGARVRLMKCAVIDCVAPICSVFVSSGFLMLGEESGVRVFHLRLLVKGEVRDKRDCKLNKSQGCGFKCGASCDCSRLQNGVIESVCESKSATVDGSAKTCSNGIIQKAGVNSNGARRTLRLKQDSSNCGIIFVTFSTLQDQSQTSKSPFFSLKSTSIHALSEKIFVVLDSAGDLHLLNLYNTFPGSEISGKMRHLKSTMKVQMLAVFPDVSTNLKQLLSIAETQTLWISDGFYSVHILPITELDIPLDELDEIESEEKRMQNSDNKECLGLIGRPSRKEARNEEKGIAMVCVTSALRERGWCGANKGAKYSKSN
ncbi:hypothetical protein Sjap_015061 [Stephania japonica]|uniref:Uncharacterized protein n=1 Tax=Stephania japonica TaxID=461633 RepID=A0AAP0IIF3_9MAGN